MAASSFWDKLNPFESEEGKPQVDPNKNLTSQLNGTTVPKPAPVIPNYNYQPQQFPGATPGIFTTAVQLSEEDKTKWQNHVSKVYTDVRSKNPVYDEFENQVEALATVMPGEQQRVQAVGELMKKKGVSKINLVNAAQAVLTSIQDAKTEFDQDYAARTKTGITDPQATIADKQQQILQLNADIAQLNQTITENQNKLAIRQYGFSTYFQQLLNKISGDANAISSSVLE